MAKLILLQGGAATPFDLNNSETTLGRLPECTIQVQSNMVSRKHARILQQDDRYVLEDLGSGNGSFVNGKQINEPTPLKHDDRVKIGPILFRFEGDGAPEDKSTAAPTLVEGSGHETMIDITGDDGNSTIMGSLDTVGGFGLLDVNPEAKLKAILEISRSLAGTVNIEALLPRILDTFFDIFPHADRGCILIEDEETKAMVPRAMKHRREDTDESVKLSRTILNQVFEQKQAILSADAASDERFDAAESISNLTIRSMMCAPLLSLSGDPIGVINIDTQNPLAQFKKEDLDIMVAVAGQAALSVESAKLMSTFIEKQKQDNEMKIASNVQLALLPDTLPEIPGYEFFASYEAAQAVGGDYYDVFPITGGKVCLAFGDVAGKGVPASLVMSRLSSVVRSTFQHVTDVAKAVAQINDHMCDKAVEGRFVTFVCAVLDPVKHTISVVNAGHMSPIFRTAKGKIEEFDDKTVGIPLGVLEEFPYKSVDRKLSPGETAVLYTDGVSEAMNHQSELYGLERLREFIAKAPSHADELGKFVREDVKKHADGRPQNDDITMMVFGRNL
ncbi:MAG: SpoIIE family protein phosphatase [Planctomycetaceae bacterium]|nr:SpoIIE family protein phosphatase [Planctomycetaceae bacterium]